MNRPVKHVEVRYYDGWRRQCDSDFLDKKRIRISVWFDDYNDNHHTEFSVNAPRNVIVSRLRKLAELVAEGCEP